MSKCATVVIDVDKNDREWSILNVKSHENSIEAKAYAFDEILRLAEDFSVDNEVTVEFYRDNYGEYCTEVSCAEAKIVMKTMFQEETNQEGGDNE